MSIFSVYKLSSMCGVVAKLSAVVPQQSRFRLPGPPKIFCLKSFLNWISSWRVQFKAVYPYILNALCVSVCLSVCAISVTLSPIPSRLIPIDRARWEKKNKSKIMGVPLLKKLKNQFFHFRLLCFRMWSEMKTTLFICLHGSVGKGVACSPDRRRFDPRFCLKKIDLFEKNEKLDRNWKKWKISEKLKKFEKTWKQVRTKALDQTWAAP